MGDAFIRNVLQNSIIYNSRMTIVSEAPCCGIIPTTLEMSFRIVIFLHGRPQVSLNKATGTEEPETRTALASFRKL
jgi:hypothetical protein